MSAIQYKLWGTDTNIYCNGTVSVHVLRIQKGGTCSLHLHKSKHNKFHVISGVLRIVIQPPEVTPPTLVTFDHLGILHSGDTCTIKPGQKHQFQAMEDTVVIETVFVELDKNDIQRIENGFNFQSEYWREIK